MSLLRWFEPATTSPWLRLLTGLLLLIMAIVAILAHWPSSLPGPLTPSEQGRRALSWFFRWSMNLFLLVLVAGSVVAVTFMLAPPREPVTIVLHSRLRPTAAVAVDLIDDGASRLDLGPAVDAVLEECRKRGAAAWVDSTPGTRDAVRGVVLDKIGSIELPRVPPGGQPLANTSKDLPPWVISSVEYSLTRMAMHQHNVTTVRIAPGPSRSGQGWLLAAKLIDQADSPVSVVDPMPVHEDGFEVRRLTGARWQKSTARIQAWAVITGRFPQNSHESVKIPFKLTLGDPTAGGRSIDLQPLEISPEPRAVESRLVPLQFALPNEVDPERLVVGNVLPTLSDRAGNCSTRISVDGSTPRPAQISIQPPTTAWTDALARVRTAPEFEEFVRELSSLGLSIPSVTLSQPDVPVLLISGNRAIIAKTEATARKILSAVLSPITAAAVSPTARVVETRIEPGTVFSWLALPVVSPEILTNLPGEAGVIASVADQPLTRGRESSKMAKSLPAILSIGQSGGERFVLMTNAAAVPPSADTPLLLTAQVRSLCWAIRYIGDHSDLEIADGAGDTSRGDISTPSSPLVTDLDLQKATSFRLATLDRIVVLIVGGCLALMLGRILRDTPL